MPARPLLPRQVAPPYRVAEFDLTFASGINHLAGVVDAGAPTTSRPPRVGPAQP